MMDDQERLRDLVRRANADKNGTGPPMAPPGVTPRPSGWKCPKCGNEAEERVLPDPGSLLGFKRMTLADEPQLALFYADDHRRSPVAVNAAEVTKRDESGNPIATYATLHCLPCFNAWQKKKMMEEIRANVPQLVWEEPDAGNFA